MGKIKLLYIQWRENVVIVSGGQWRDSAIPIHVSILPKSPFLSRLPHNTEQSSLSCTVGPCWLSILNTVCTCPSQTPNYPFLPTTIIQILFKWAKCLGSEKVSNLPSVTHWQSQRSQKRWPTFSERQEGGGDGCGPTSNCSFVSNIYEKNGNHCSISQWWLQISCLVSAYERALPPEVFFFLINSSENRWIACCCCC